MRSVPAFLAAAVAVLLPAAAVPATGGLDYGDAPDGAPAGYAHAPAVAGAFPSKAARGGPRLAAAGPRLGAGWTADPDSRQVDRDADDGASVTARSCATSTVTLLVDASRADPDAPIYVNAWFDWNQDGDWADGGTRSCGPEWAIQNRAVAPATLGPARVGLVTLRFRAGKVPAQFWWRAQVHQGSLAPHLGGRAAATASGGEVEDRLEDRARRPAVGLSCSGGFLTIVPHGVGADVVFALDGVAGHDVRVVKVAHAARGDVDGIVLARHDPVPNHWRVRVTSAKHERDRPLQSLRVELEVTAIVDGTSRTFKRSCGLAVAHTQRVSPPYVPPEKLTPAPTGRAVVDPDKPTPEAARCAAAMVDGYAFFAVRTVCRGVDVKSTTMWAATAVFDAEGPGEESGTRLSRCRWDTATDALKCLWKPGNKGTVLEYRIQPREVPAGRFTIHVLAGGRGDVGTAIVLRQDWYSFGGGQFRCVQSVPRAAACSTPG